MYRGGMEPQHTPATLPIKLAIADSLRIAIEQGDLGPGDSLPTLNELTEEWGCSITSAREALGILKQQGLVSGGRGRPLRVRSRGVPTVRSSTRHQLEKDRVHLPLEERKKVGTSELETKTQLEDVVFSATYDQAPATAEISRELGITEGDEVLIRFFEMKSPKSGYRTAWSVSYIPISLISQNPELLDSTNEPWPGGTMHQLSTVGIEVIKVVDDVTSRMSTTVERELWGLESGVPMMKVRRKSYDKNGQAVEISDAEFPADRTLLEFVTELKEWNNE